MSSRTDFFFRQKVTEAELDLAFELLEKADRNLAADIGLYGIISGAEPAPHAPLADLTIDLAAPARCYDRLGQRIFFGSGQRVDCAVDSFGIPADVTAAGRERWLGIFLRFDRLLSDPRTDGNSQQVYFRRDESFGIVVRQAPEGAAGAAPKVPHRDDELLVCDVLRRHGQTQIIAGDIDSSRRQAFVFATGEAIEVVSGLWSVLAPAVNTVQAALDSVDTVLARHLGGTAHRHPARDVEYIPHGFVAATHVQAALDEVVDDLESTTAGDPGAARVGADAVAGTPNALPAGNVDGQLSQLLAWLNNHLGAAAGAHAASAISAAVHNYIAGTSVQAQLQEIVNQLLAQTGGTPGSSRIGADAVTGSPSSLAADTVDAQLSTLLGYLNAHVAASSGAHAAASISVADTGGNLNAENVEAALAEVLDAFEDDHYRGNETNAGRHRAIHQPLLGSGRVLLWDAIGAGGPSARLRVYIDADNVWFTLNAAWTGSAWSRDIRPAFSGGFSFSRYRIEFLHDDTAGASFTTWNRRWTLEFRGESNSSFSLVGSITEVGRVGVEGVNMSNTTRQLVLGSSTTFRARFPAPPSSITLRPLASGNVPSPPTVYLPDEDGFVFLIATTLLPSAPAYWFGTYTAVA